MIKLNNLVKVRVYQLANKNQYVICYHNPNVNQYEEYKDIFAFQSYNTIIALYIPFTKELFINWNKWDYSKTTLKHLKLFINEYTGYHYETKQQFMKLIRYHSNFILFEE